MNTVKCSNHLCGKEYNVQFDKCPFCGTVNPMNEEERKVLIEKEKAENVSVEDESTSQFHWLIVGLIWISIIFFGVRGVISSFTNMIFSPTIGIITLVLSLVGMVSLFFILRAKKWALFLWIAYRLAGGVVNGLINTKFDFATNIIIALVNIGLMLLVLQLKNNGVSAWSLIFKKKVSKTDNKENVDKEITSKDSLDTTSEQNEERIRAEQRGDRTENFAEIPSQDIADTLYDEQINQAIPEDKKLEQPVISTTPPTEEKPEDKLIVKSEDTIKTKGNRDNTPEKKKSLLRNSWWIFLIVIVAVLAAVWIVVLISHRDSSSEIGEYVYVDNSSILHSKRDCKNIAVYRGAKPVTIYLTNELTPKDWRYVCSKCIDDKKYQNIIRRGKPILPSSPFKCKRDELYWELISSGKVTEKEIGTLEEFKKAIYNEAKTKKLYNNLINSGLFSSNEIGTEEVFLSKIISDFQLDEKGKHTNLKDLHGFLLKEGYNLPNYSEFLEDMKDEQKLYKLWFNLREDGYELPNQFSVFKSDMGF